MPASDVDAPINWKRNLTIAWLGCFLTGAAFSLVMPFLPLYVEQLGVTGHSELNLWSGIVFSITFLFSAIASPLLRHSGAVWPIEKAEKSCCCARRWEWLSSCC